MHDVAVASQVGDEHKGTVGNWRQVCAGSRFRRSHRVVLLAIRASGVALDSRPDTHWIAVLLGPEGAAEEEFAARTSEPEPDHET